MGMFDSFYDEQEAEWQTKAYSRNLDVYRIGDVVPADSPGTYQVEIIGCGRREPNDRWSLATIRDGILASIDDRRDPSLPLLHFTGSLAAPVPGGVAARKQEADRA